MNNKIFQKSLIKKIHIFQKYFSSIIVDTYLNLLLSYWYMWVWCNMTECESMSYQCRYECVICSAGDISFRLQFHKHGRSKCIQFVVWFISVATRYTEADIARMQFCQKYMKFKCITWTCAIMQTLAGCRNMYTLV